MQKFRKRRGGLLACLALVACGAGPVLAEQAIGEAATGKSGSAPGAFVADTWQDVVSLPTIANAWWLVGGVVLTISVHQFEDAPGAAQAFGRGPFDPISEFGNVWGDVRLQVPLAVGTWGLGNALNSREMASLGYDLSRGLLISYGLVGAIKLGVNRTRPNGEDYSFPSGHTVGAFTTAGVVSRRYGAWAGGIAVGLGLATGMGRMEDSKHYASDVAAGATIGWIVGRQVGREKQLAGLTWRWVPLGSGLAVAGRF